MNGQHIRCMLTHTTEAISREPLPCVRLDHLQMGPTGKPG
uniref:Uncharacterized protein n=1 Tax=Anguilla anguilla TaxID=7936 RepID=A0A0E9TAV9_ANGAN